MKFCYGVILSFAIIFFIVGLPVFIAFYLRWQDSVDFEDNSTVTTCKILQVTTSQICTDDNGGYTGTKWGYNVETPRCPGAVIYRGDDTCNDSPLLVNSSRECRVHDDCQRFKWKHHTTTNKNSAFVGAAFLGLSFVLCIIFCVLFVQNQRRKAQDRELPHPRPQPDTCPDDNIEVEVHEEYPPAKEV
eukprot:TRINITY_DN2385_c0_g1_i1.p1 TRINITY_DN2385_c0_g1~~TRINITY_DN2385_c0_g1_i1.p1  ORF type:complete len:208 (+),score=16.34 TRINITY_DN2385_c0_g1_i1:62-625(+)